MNLILASLEHHTDDKTLEAFEKAETQYRLEGGYELRSKAEKMLLGLGFDKSQMNDSPRSLSGGWRMRVALAAALSRGVPALLRKAGFTVDGP